MKKENKKIIGTWQSVSILFIDPTDPLKKRVLAEVEPIKIKFYAEGVVAKPKIEFEFNPPNKKMKNQTFKKLLEEQEEKFDEFGELYQFPFMLPEKVLGYDKALGKDPIVGRAYSKPIKSFLRQSNQAVIKAVVEEIKKMKKELVWYDEEIPLGKDIFLERKGATKERKGYNQALNEVVKCLTKKIGRVKSSNGKTKKVSNKSRISPMEVLAKY